MTVWPQDLLCVFSYINHRLLDTTSLLFRLLGSLSLENSDGQCFESRYELAKEMQRYFENLKM